MTHSSPPDLGAIAPCNDNEEPAEPAFFEVVMASPLWARALDNPAALTERALTAASGVRAQPITGLVAVAFSDDAGVQALNGHYRGKDAPTNVLAFPAPSGLGDAWQALGPSHERAPLGDVVLAFETIAREARERGLALRDHVLHLIVHGYLHLEGYDHVRESDATIMETLETRILATLGVADPYEAERDV